MSDDILKAVREGLDGIKSQMNGKLSEIEADIRELQQGRSTIHRMPGAATKNMGDIVLNAPEAKALMEGRTKQAVIPVNLDVKTLVGTGGDSNDDPVNVQAQRARGFGEDGRRSLQLLADLPRVLVNSGSYEFHRLNSFSNAAAVQAVEGETKAEQSMDIPIVTANIATVAVTIPCSEQLLADHPDLRQFLNSKLRYGVLEKLESEIIGGTGGQGFISGLENEATSFTPPAGRTYADRVAAALTELEVRGWMPTHVIMHPRDWDGIRTIRVEAGTGEYLVESWASDVAKGMWGVPVVTSNSVTEGSAMAIDARQLALLDRQQANVVMGYSNAGFVENVITMRCELRAGLAVYSPTAVIQFDLAAS